jgi:hypothetical protein
VLVEIALIFAVFFLQGAWPAPDVNEPYYLGKAIHYWNPDRLRGDFFMETPDVHKVFDFGFGWFSLWLPPVPLAWTGRILTWLLLAWAWRRLSWAVAPRAWCSVLTAALFGWLMENCQMAGEWVIGGVEAKGFAYVLVFLGLEAIVRNRWNRGLLWLGGASAVHVLVGGWAAVAAGIAWLWLHVKPRAVVADDGATTGRGFMDVPRLRSLWPGLVGGLLLALPGIIPSLTLDWGTSDETVIQAHEIYVFQRLPHHLILTEIRPWFILRLGLLWGFWLLLGRWERRRGRQENLCRLRAFVTGAVVITLSGAAINGLIHVDRGLAAELLRFYWFRLTDVALPLGVALESVWLLVAASARPAGGTALRLSHPTSYYCCWAGWLLAIGVAGHQVGGHALERIAAGAPRSDKMAGSADWRAACEWVARSGKIPPGACFLVPRGAQTFSWYSGHGDVVTWKDVPQDAKGLVAWWRRMEDIYGNGLPPPARWYGSLSDLGASRLGQLGAKYHAGYAITERSEPPLGLEVVYENQTYIIYWLR